MDRKVFIDWVPIKFYPGEKNVFISELCGYDEQNIRGTRSFDAIKLLNNLITGGVNSSAISGNANKLTISDRDRILSAIYINTYGTKIETTLKCNACQNNFDIDFSLEEMLDKLNSEKEIEHSEKDSEFVFKLNNEVRFRLPTGEDELAVLGNSTDQIESELLARCIIKGNEKNDLANVQEALENLAPLINLYFEVSCPECDNIQNLHFDIQHYLLSSLIQEQKQLIYEVHKLAYAHKWGLKEILELPRSIRKSYVSEME